MLMVLIEDGFPALFIQERLGKTKIAKTYKSEITENIPTLNYK